LLLFETIKDDDALFSTIDRMFADYTIFRTPYNLETIRAICSAADGLQRNRFAGKAGSGHSILLGNRGARRTTVLKALTTIIPKLFPKIIVIYVQMGMIGKSSIAQILEHELSSHDQKCRTPGQVPGYFTLAERLQQTLVNYDLRVLLLVDDIEELYKAHSDAQSARQNVADFHSLEKCNLGRLTMCLFTTSTNFLLQSNNDEDSITFLKLKYPLLEKGGPPVVAGVDYSYAPSPLPTDLSSVAVITGSFCNSATKPWLRAVAFCTGCCPRCVLDFLTFKLSDAFVFCSHHKGATALHNLIHRMLYKANKSMLQAMLGGTVEEAVQNVCGTAWEERLKPATYDEVSRAWEKMFKLNQLPHYRDFYIFHYLLIDLVSTSAVRCSGKSIYPYSIANLVFHVPGAEEHMSTLMSAVRDVAKKGHKAAAALSARPRAVAGVSRIKEGGCLVM